MDKGWLEECLAVGMSLDAIGERAGRHPSTVSYWLKKHGLRASKGLTHSPKGPVDKQQLLALIDEELSLAEIAERLSRHRGSLLD